MVAGNRVVTKHFGFKHFHKHFLQFSRDVSFSNALKRRGCKNDPFVRQFCCCHCQPYSNKANIQFPNLQYTMRSKFTVFTGLKQAKFCQTGCFGIGAVAYVIPQVPRGGDSRSLGRSKCLPTRCKSLENLTRSLLLALSKIGGKYSNFTPL